MNFVIESNYRHSHFSLVVVEFQFNFEITWGWTISSLVIFKLVIQNHEIVPSYVLKICNKLEIEMLFCNVQTQYLYLNPLKHQQHQEHIYESSFIKTDNIYLN